MENQGSTVPANTKAPDVRKPDEKIKDAVSSHSIFDYILQSSGARTSIPLVESLVEALKLVPLTNDVGKAMTLHWKSFNLDPNLRTAVEADVKARARASLQAVNRSLTKSVKDAGSAPWISHEEATKVVWKFIDELAEKTSVDKRALYGWGTWAQIPYFADMADLIMKEIALVGTTVSKMAYAKFTYNICDFKDMRVIVETRWRFTMQGLNDLTDYMEWVDEGHPAMGRKDRRYVSGRYILSDDGYKFLSDRYIDRDVDEAGNKDKMSPADFMQRYDSPLNLLEEGNTPDVRRLLQCKDARKAHNKLYKDGADRADVASYVASLMYDIIVWWRGEDEFKGVIDVNTESEFSKLYYKCVGEISATRRDIVNYLLGKKGDADTRSGWQGSKEIRRVKTALSDYESLFNAIAADSETEETVGSGASEGAAKGTGATSVGAATPLLGALRTKTGGVAPKRTTQEVQGKEKK